MIRVSAILAAFSLTALVAPRLAQASCESPEPQLFDSVPAEGASEVPTDVDIVLFHLGEIETVELDGSALPRTPEHAWDPGLLQPQTTYEVTVHWAYFDHSTSFSFTTGDSAAAGAAPDPPGVTDLEIFDEPYPAGKCTHLATRTGCADENTPEFAAFKVEPSASVGWFIRGGGHPEFDQLWPANCGDPLWYGYPQEDRCFEVQAFDSAGRASGVVTRCAAVQELPEAGTADLNGSGDAGDGAVAPDGGASDGGDGAVAQHGSAGGCSTSDSARFGAWWVLLLMFSLTPTRRVLSQCPRVAAALVTPFLAFGVGLRTAHAACNNHLIEVYASIPEAEATGVPTDVEIVLFSTGELRRVDLDGVPMQQTELGEWDPGLLEPDTTYEVAVYGPDPTDPHTFSFTTGAGPAVGAGPTSPEVDVVREHSAPPANLECIELAQRTGCPDHGEATYVSFSIGGSVPAGWVIKSGGHEEFNQLWPARCGTPWWHGYPPADGCYFVAAIDDAGRRSPPTRTCASEPQVPEGCSTSSSPAPRQFWPVALLLVFASFRGPQRRGRAARAPN